MHDGNQPRRRDGTGAFDMTTTTIAQTQSGNELLAIAVAALIGVGLIFVAGFSTAAVLHDVGHDARHAVAFPCH